MPPALARYVEYCAEDFRVRMGWNNIMKRAIRNIFMAEGCQYQ